MSNQGKKSRVLRIQEVTQRTGLSRSLIYVLMKQGTFPQSIKLSQRAVGWFEDELLGWFDRRVAERAGP